MTYNELENSNKWLDVIQKIEKRKEAYVKFGLSSSQTEMRKDLSDLSFRHEYYAYEVYTKHFDKTTQKMPQIREHNRNSITKMAFLKKALNLTYPPKQAFIRSIFSIIENAIDEVRLEDPSDILSKFAFSTRVSQKLLANLPTRVYTDLELDIVLELHKYAHTKRTFMLSLYENGLRKTHNEVMTPIELYNHLQSHQNLRTKDRYFINHFIDSTNLNITYLPVRRMLMCDFSIEFLSDDDIKYLNLKPDSLNLSNVEKSLEILRKLQSKNN